MLNPIWVGSKMSGKRWNGITKPMVVLHTLEFNAWPQTWKWDSPSHFVYNPNTRELRQYVSLDKAAAQAYAMVGNGLCGGCYEPLVKHMMIDKAEGSVLDYVYWREQL